MAGHSTGRLTHLIVRQKLAPDTCAASSNDGSIDRTGPANKKNIIGVNINPWTKAIPHTLVILKGACFRSNRDTNNLLMRPTLGLNRMNQPIAFKNPGTIIEIAINVIHNSLYGTLVRCNSQAKGTLKNKTTATVPNPTIAVFGMTRRNK